MTLLREGSSGEINNSLKKDLTIDNYYDSINLLDFFERSEDYEG